jgi:hypothetical protein
VVPLRAFFTLEDVTAHAPSPEQRRADESGAARPAASSRRDAPLAAVSSVLMAIALILGLTALLCSIGADSQWLAALGRAIVAHHALPSTLPFASASSANWPNPLVLAELVFYALERGMGDRGLMVAQLLAVGICFAVLARDALRSGASDERTAATLLIAAGGTLPALAIARVQLFSIALFPVLVAVLRADARRPSKRIWLIVVIIAVWANLHGAVLVGLATALAYLALGRFRHDPRTTVGVAAAAVAALWLTPAFIHTLSYYHGVLSSVAARRGAGLWARPSVSEPLDDLAFLALLFLAWRARRARLSLWEWTVVVGLAVVAAGASRSLVWLVLFLVAPAARSRPSAGREWGHLAPLTAVAAAVAIGLALARGPGLNGGGGGLVPRAIALARGTPILASDILGERIALKGGRIWVGNPLDAFSTREQAEYLDWLEGRAAGRKALTPSVGVVLVSRGTAAERLMAGLHGYAPVARDRQAVLYQRTR